MTKELWWSRRKKDFRIDWFSGTGAGGQHRNRHRNCCRLVDKETRITTVGQEHRSRQQNLKDAFCRMVKLLLNHYKERDLPKKDDFPREASFGIKATRSYDLESDRVIDHVTKKKHSYRHTVGKNDISEIVKDRKNFLDSQKLNKENPLPCTQGGC